MVLQGTPSAFLLSSAVENMNAVCFLSCRQARVCSGGSHLTIRISDQGGGISQEHLHQVTLLWQKHLL
jgi:hypothetical protein